jgi:uncharacterized protein YbjT (DUF2867 family)
LAAELRTPDTEGHMYTILGASGNTGGIITEKLLAQGQKVRAVGRDRTRLAGATQRGAEAFIADAIDANTLAEAFSGAQAVYVLNPPNPGDADVRRYQERVNTAVATAIQKSGVRYAVVLSSVGADKADRTGPVVALHNLEKKLSAIDGLNALFLRAGYFMENLLAQVGVIQAMGTIAGPLRADLAVPLIATRDIGNAAADALLKLDFKGATARELLGPRDVSYTEIAKVVGAAIGKPGLGYMQAPAMMLKPALMRMGLSGSMVDLLLEMSEALNNGYMTPLEARSAENSTPTTVETWVAEVFVPAFRGKAAQA